MSAESKSTRSKNPKKFKTEKAMGIKNLKDKLFGKKITRIDLRLDSELKEHFLRGALLSGYQSLSNFILSTVKEKSDKLLEEHERLVLSREAWNQVISLLENPPLPNEALIKAAQRHEELGFE